MRTGACTGCSKAQAAGCGHRGRRAAASGGRGSRRCRACPPVVSSGARYDTLVALSRQYWQPAEMVILSAQASGARHGHSRRPGGSHPDGTRGPRHLDDGAARGTAADRATAGGPGLGPPANLHMAIKLLTAAVLALAAAPRCTALSQPPTQMSHGPASAAAHWLQVNVTTFSASGVKTVAARESAETPVQKLARLTAAAEAGPAALPGPAQDAAQKRAVATAQASQFCCTDSWRTQMPKKVVAVCGPVPPVAPTHNAGNCKAVITTSQTVQPIACSTTGAGHVQCGQPAQVAGGAAPGPAGR